ncbi:hypothetical protein HHI36_016792 [Cryptolaemus montrouzieri]|uniref:ADP-ribosylation factor-like protein 6-interacting protein 4 n=1 Tax=Cryptolaemus montrouzieri TaxID=559131 RepID=A0ABD2NL74_9CUCU
MDSENNKLKSNVKVNFKRKVLKKRKHVSSSSSSSDDCNEKLKYKKNKKRMGPHQKKRVHTTKHKHGKARYKSSSSDSSSSEDTSTSSSSETSSSSSSSEEEKTKPKKKANKSKKNHKAVPSLTPPKFDDGPSNDIPLELMGGSRVMAPVTKEEWEKKQNVVRRVYDETTGRNRLIKGDGEVIEEIVSRDRHKQINQQATQG